MVSHQTRLQAGNNYRSTLHCVLSIYRKETVRRNTSCLSVSLAVSGLLGWSVCLSFSVSVSRCLFIIYVFTLYLLHSYSCIFILIFICYMFLSGSQVVCMHQLPQLIPCRRTRSSTWRIKAILILILILILIYNIFTFLFLMFSPIFLFFLPVHCIEVSQPTFVFCVGLTPVVNHKENRVSNLSSDFMLSLVSEDKS